LEGLRGALSQGEPIGALVYRTGDLGRWHPAHDEGNSCKSSGGGGGGGINSSNTTDVVVDCGGSSGWLEVCGRADGQLKVSGRRVEAAEVEVGLMAACGDCAKRRTTDATPNDDADADDVAAAAAQRGGAVRTEGEEGSPLCLVAACAAAVGSDGRLGVVAVPSNRLWASLTFSPCPPTPPKGNSAGAGAAEEPEGGEGLEVLGHEGLSLAVRRACARGRGPGDALPPHLIPAVVAFVRALPLTPTGKVGPAAVSPRPTSTVVHMN
jgi:acyl-CoA synthetase (AMP-forming)/AMP-acid ligase II